MARSAEVVASVGLSCGQRLLLVRHPISTRAYDGPSRGGNVEVLLERARGRRRSVRSLADLGPILRPLQCDIVSSTRGHEADLACILAQLADLGRVVASVDLYSFLEERYGVPVAPNLPRLEGSALRFLCGRFDFDREPTLTDVAIDLESFEMHAARVPLRRPTGS